MPFSVDLKPGQTDFPTVWASGLQCWQLWRNLWPLSVKLDFAVCSKEGRSRGSHGCVPASCPPALLPSWFMGFPFCSVAKHATGLFSSSEGGLLEEVADRICILADNHLNMLLSTISLQHSVFISAFWGAMFEKAWAWQVLVFVPVCKEIVSNDV